MTSEVTVTIAGQKISTVGAIRALKIEQQDRHIDMVTITAGLDLLPRSAFTAGTPVHISWGQVRGNHSHLPGYIFDPHGHQAKNRRKTEVKVLGAGMRMRETHRQVWRGYSIPQIARTIAKRNRMGIVADNHGARWSAIPQECGDWKFLVQLAETIGWTLDMDGTTIRFLDRQLLPGRQGSKQPVIQVGRLPIYEFEVQDASVGHERRPALRRATFTDLRTGHRYRFKSEQIRRPTVTGQESPARDLVIEDFELEDESYSEALATFTGIEEENAWTTTARVTAPGDHRIRPGMAVFLDTPPREHHRTIPTDSYAGEWIVHQATHDLKFKNRSVATYTMELELRRDGRGFGAPRRRPSKPVPVSPTARLLQDRWISSWGLSA